MGDLLLAPAAENNNTMGVGSLHQPSLRPRERDSNMSLPVFCHVQYLMRALTGLLFARGVVGGPTDVNGCERFAQWVNLLKLRPG
jgi:hypothetical protein